jgi:mannose-6-phosphate isomerase-like protein (cupin superfamily)
MAVLRSSDAPTHELGPVGFAALATPSRGTTTTTLWTISVPVGAPPTPHALTNEELFFVLQGTARVLMDGQTEEANVGDCIVVPAMTVFELTNAGQTTLRLVSCMPVGTEAVIGETRFVPPWTA